MGMDKIIAGDFVVVSFHNAQLSLARSATVIHVPIATGDSWVFRDGTHLHYVSEGCTITRVDAALGADDGR